ncbi:MAG: hypothetical protein AB1750_17870 [Chloroflexota bacterium]
MPNTRRFLESGAVRITEWNNATLGWRHKPAAMERRSKTPAPSSAYCGSMMWEMGRGGHAGKMG